MDGRKERGQEIAAKPGIRKTPRGGYLVPSQSGQGKYAVTDADTQARCTCPDFELRAEPCKHIWAVRIVIQQSLVFDGETVTETVSITKTTVQQNYPQRLAGIQRGADQRKGPIPSPAPGPGRRTARARAEARSAAPVAA